MNCFSGLSAPAVSILHEKLLEITVWDKRIELIEQFLLDQLLLSGKRLNKAAVLADIMNELKRDDFFDNMDNLASRYGISSRYLQKLFLQYTGLTPK